MRSTSERRRAQAEGRRGESLAAWWLRLKGYRIVSRGYRTPVGEIDLIARRGRVLALIEVKRRPDLAGAAEAIGRKQRRRIARAAEAFLKSRPDLVGLTPRFDAMLLVPRRRPRHMTNLWEVE